MKPSRSGSQYVCTAAMLICLVILSFGFLGATISAMPQSQSASPSPAQTLPASGPAPRISIDTQLVNVLATVRDKHGAIVKNLTKDDFIIEEDTHPQTITYFVQETDLPLTLGLLVDTSMSQARVLGDERDASRTFIDHVLREDKDRTFLIHFDKEVELLQDLTSSRQKLESALNLLQTPQQDDNQGGYGGGPGGGYGRGRGRSGGGTQLYDAIYLASNELMKNQQGRKALVVLTDGVDRGSRESLEDAVESAQRANTLVYSVLFSGEERSGFGGPHWGMGPMGGPMGGGGHHRFPQEERPDGKKVLEKISSETGAQMFEVSKKQSIEQIYASIEDELRNEYSIGYAPPTDETAGYHTIHVTTKQKDLTVQARTGYYFEPVKSAPIDPAPSSPSSGATSR